MNTNKDYKTVQSLNEKEFYVWVRSSPDFDRFTEYQMECIKNRVDSLMENGYSE